MYKLITAILLLTVSSTNYAACNTTITRTAPDSRYELLNSNAEVKDKQTGLIWQRCSLGQTWNGTNCTGNATNYNWLNALQTAKNFGNGWRVPNIKELDTLIEQACYNPSINNVFFPNTQSDWYWSSSPIAFDNGAWIVHFDDGSANSNGGKNYIGFVRLVR